MDEFVFDKMCEYYHKACEEFGIKRSEVGLFTFTNLWVAETKSLETNDFSLIYEKIKTDFVTDMKDSETVATNKELLKLKKQMADLEENHIAERVYDYDDQADDYDLQFGPVRR